MREGRPTKDLTHALASALKHHLGDELQPLRIGKRPDGGPVDWRTSEYALRFGHINRDVHGYLAVWWEYSVKLGVATSRPRAICGRC